jgi:hypothetical protein
MRTLAHRHEVLGVRLYDPLEMELPNLGMLVMQDAETGEQLFVDTHDAGFRRRFASQAGAREERLQEEFSEAGVDALELATDEPLVEAVMRFAEMRKVRNRLGGGVAQSGAGLLLNWCGHHDFHLARDALAPAGGACAGAALLVGAPAQEEAALSYANLAIVRQAMGPAQKLRRHIPPVLFLTALTLMIAAVARPTAVVTLPFDQQTVILAIDVSLSMRADDVQPSRMEAAQAAAKSFVEDQPRATRIGVVSFAGTASVVQPPTQTREDIIGAIDRFKLQRGTAVGSGSWCP